MLLNEISKGVKALPRRKKIIFFPLLEACDGYYTEFFNHFSLRKNFFLTGKSV